MHSMKMEETRRSIQCVRGNEATLDRKKQQPTHDSTTHGKEMETGRSEGGGVCK